MGADLRLESMDRELNELLWDVRAAAHASLDKIIHGGEPVADPFADELEGKEPEQEEPWRNTGLIWPILNHIERNWDERASFHDPYNRTAYSAYMGFSYAPYEHEGKITPDAAARLLTYLEELEDERIYGPDAEACVAAYWDSYERGGQADNPSESMQIGEMLEALYQSIPGATGGAPGTSEDKSPIDWLSIWGAKHERLTSLLRTAISRGEPLECTGVIYHEEG